MHHNRKEKYLEYVYPEAKDRQPTESEAECIARDRSWSEYFFDKGAGKPICECNRLASTTGNKTWTSVTENDILLAFSFADDKCVRLSRSIHD